MIKPEDNFNPEDLADYKSLSIATRNIIDNALEKDIKVEILDSGKNIGLTQGKTKKRFYTSVTSDSDPVAVRIARNKVDTYIHLARNNIPVPDYIFIDSDDNLGQAAKKIDFPVVIKPAKETSGGQGVFANIKDLVELEKVGEKTKKIAKRNKSRILVEKYHIGKDFRALVIDYRLIHVIERVPAFVTGDGQSTIKELIDKKNKDPQRGSWYNSPLRKIEVDEEVERVIDREQLTLKSILPKSEQLFLRKNANISMGGEAFAVTDRIPPEVSDLLEQAARVIGLNIVGIDIICQDISQPLTKDNGVIIEVNSNPGFAGHVHPTKGKSCNPGKYVIEMLFDK